MVTAQLLDYIRQQVAAGVSREQITQSMVSGGWQISDLNEAFIAIASAHESPIQTEIVSPIQPTAALTSVKEYAGFWRRFAASLVDGSILSLSFVVVGIAVEIVPNGTFFIQMMFIFLVLFLFIFQTWLESSTWQGTIGKHLMGLTVTNLEGVRISFLRALARNLAKIISMIPLLLGFVMAGFTARKQALHDMIVGTLVVKEKPAKVGLVLLAILGPQILSVVTAIILGSFFFATLIGSFLAGTSTDTSGPTSFSFSLETSTTTTSSTSSSATATSTVTATTKAQYDLAFAQGAADVKQINSRSAEPSTIVGPALIQIVWPSGYTASLELAVFIANIPNLEAPGAKVIVSLSSLNTKEGSNVLDAKSPFNTDESFTQISDLTRHTVTNEANVVTYYYLGNHTVNILAGKSILPATFTSLAGTPLPTPAAAAFQSIQGNITFTLPATDGVYSKSYPFTITN